MTMPLPEHPTRRQTLLALAASLGAGHAAHALAAPASAAHLADDGDLPWPRALAVPGGVARVDLGPAAQRPLAWSGDAPLLVLGDAIAWTALVGIPLSAPAGQAHIRVQAGEGAAGGMRSLPYAVAPKQYPEQRLKVAPRTVELAPADLARHQRERAHQQQVMATFSPLPQALAAGQLGMRLPCAGRRSSAFGLRRVFNGQARNPHSGIDIAAPSGTPVAAPLAGRVIDAGEYFFNGRTLWLDHGGGLLSMLCHLSRIDCAVGDQVATGQHLAAVGATGRATGPHLHWTVCLNRASVDPDLFVMQGAAA